MLKRKVEKPIRGDMSVEKEKVLAAMREKAGPSPYDSEAHAEAVKYIQDRKIKLRAI